LGGARLGEIVYCNTCGDRILTSDFEKGRAVVILKRNYCATCAEAIEESKPEPSKEATVRKNDRRPTVRVPTLEKALISRTQLIMLISIAAFLLALIVVIMTKK
jgi:hypothetical protein